MRKLLALPLLLSLPVAACSMFGGGGSGPQASAESQPSSYVSQAQQKLADLGYYKGNIDGIAGQSTHDAIRQFQQQHGLTANGMLDPNTDQQLMAQNTASNNTNSNMASNGNMPNDENGNAENNQSSGGTYAQGNNQSEGSSTQGNTGNAHSNVRQAQQQLAQMGLYHGRIDGIDGPATRAALRQFQNQHGLNANGRLDQRTEQALMQNEGSNGNNTAGNNNNMPSNSQAQGTYQNNATQPPNAGSSNPTMGSSSPANPAPGNTAPGNSTTGNSTTGNTSTGAPASR